MQTIEQLKAKHAKELAELELQWDIKNGIDFVLGTDTWKKYSIHLYPLHGMKGTVTYGDSYSHNSEDRYTPLEAAQLLAKFPPVPLVKWTNGSVSFIPQAYTQAEDFRGNAEPVAPILLKVDAACAGSLDGGPVNVSLDWVTKFNEGLFGIHVILNSYEVCSVSFSKTRAHGYAKPVVKSTTVEFRRIWWAQPGETFTRSYCPRGRGPDKGISDFDFTRFGGGDGIHYGSRFVYHHPDPNLDPVEWLRSVHVGLI